MTCVNHAILCPADAPHKSRYRPCPRGASLGTQGAARTTAESRQRDKRRLQCQATEELGEDTPSITERLWLKVP